MVRWGLIHTYMHGICKRVKRINVRYKKRGTGIDYINNTKICYKYVVGNNDDVKGFTILIIYRFGVFPLCNINIAIFE